MTIDTLSIVVAAVALLVPLILALIWDVYVIAIGRTDLTVCNRWRRWNIASGFLLAFAVIAVVGHVLCHWDAWR